MPANRVVDHRLGDFPLVGTGLVADGVALGYAPRRSVFDTMLVEAALEAGVEVRTGFTVEEFTADRNQITGVRGRARSGGAPIVESATVVVGADGRHSRLARWVGAERYNVVRRSPAGTSAVLERPGDIGIEIHARPDTAVFAFHERLADRGLRRLADSEVPGGPRGHRESLRGRGRRNPGAVGTRPGRQT